MRASASRHRRSAWLSGISRPHTDEYARRCPLRPHSDASPERTPDPLRRRVSAPFWWLSILTDILLGVRKRKSTLKDTVKIAQDLIWTSVCQVAGGRLLGRPPRLCARSVGAAGASATTASNHAAASRSMPGACTGGTADAAGKTWSGERNCARSIASAWPPAFGNAAVWPRDVPDAVPDLVRHSWESRDSASRTERSRA